MSETPQYTHGRSLRGNIWLTAGKCLLVFHMRSMFHVKQFYACAARARVSGTTAYLLREPPGATHSHNDALLPR